MKLFTFVAGTVNAITLAAVAAVGAYQIDQARAEQVVSSISAEDQRCMQQNIYFEARNQSTLGQVAVAWVTLNRVQSDRYPDSICGVVWQNKQFSWTHDGKSAEPGNNVLEQRAWEDAGLVTEVVLLDWALGKNGPVGAATMYHADYVDPYWSDSYRLVTKVDDHIFYQ